MRSRWQEARSKSITQCRHKMQLLCSVLHLVQERLHGCALAALPTYISVHCANMQAQPARTPPASPTCGVLNFQVEWLSSPMVLGLVPWYPLRSVSRS
jgi:hypothetical protein